MIDIIYPVIGILPKEIVNTLEVGILSLLVILIGKIFSEINKYIENLEFSKVQGFNISGIWLATFSSYIPGKHIYELVRISQNKEKIQLYIEHYNNNNKGINFLKLEGSGVFRGSKLSAVYYPMGAIESRSGVFVLRSLDNPESLEGIYAEMESTENGIILHEHENYKLTRLHYPNKFIKFKMNIIMRLHRACFKNYNDLEAFYNTIP